MTTRVLDRAGVETAVALAVRAPSIHNTQPWRWTWDGDTLALRADPDRQLQVADPDRHSLLVSCGAAKYLTELSLRAQGYAVEADLLPDPADPDLLAVFRIVGDEDPAPGLTAAVKAARARRSDRRPYTTEQVPDAQVEVLRESGRSPLTYVDFPHDREQAINLAVAVSWADRVERHYAEYQEEMQRWLRDPDVHATADGVPLSAVPRLDPDHPRRTEVPQRDFEVGVEGGVLIAQDQDEKPLIAIIFTHEDTPAEQLAAGDAMMRVMITAQIAGLASCPLSQAVDLPAFRGRMQGLMGWTGYPQMMLRIGHPSAPAEQLVATPRRDVGKVLQITTPGD